MRKHIDPARMSEKCRRGKNTRMGGSDPTFRSFGSQSDPWVAPAHPLAITVPTVFATPLQKEERGRKEKCQAKNASVTWSTVIPGSSDPGLLVWSIACQETGWSGTMTTNGGTAHLIGPRQQGWQFNGQVPDERPPAVSTLYCRCAGAGGWTGEFHCVSVSRVEHLSASNCHTCAGSVPKLQIPHPCDVLRRSVADVFRDSFGRVYLHAETEASREARPLAAIPGTTEARQGLSCCRRSTPPS